MSALDIPDTSNLFGASGALRLLPSPSHKRHKRPQALRTHVPQHLPDIQPRLSGVSRVWRVDHGWALSQSPAADGTGSPIPSGDWGGAWVARLMQLGARPATIIGQPLAEPVVSRCGCCRGIAPQLCTPATLPYCWISCRRTPGGHLCTSTAGATSRTRATFTAHMRIPTLLLLRLKCRHHPTTSHSLTMCGSSAFGQRRRRRLAAAPRGMSLGRAGAANRRRLVWFVRLAP